MPEPAKLPAAAIRNTLAYLITGFIVPFSFNCEIDVFQILMAITSC